MSQSLLNQGCMSTNNIWINELIRRVSIPFKSGLYVYFQQKKVSLGWQVSIPFKSGLYVYRRLS